MRRLLLCAALVGCTGEQIQSRGEDAAVSDASVDTSSCSTTEGNLVQNPSFEIASGDTISGWPAPEGGSIVRRTGGAGQCEAWAEVTMPAASSSFPAAFRQEIALDSPLPKGTTIRATMMVRTLDADLTGSLEINVIASGYANKSLTLNADGTWKEFSTEWVLPPDEDGARSLGVAFVSESPKERRVGIDNVRLIITRP